MAGTDRRVRALDLEFLFAGEACPMKSPDFIAVDWGTTNRRVYRIDAAGSVLQRQSDDKGVLSIANDGFAAAVAEIRADFGDLSILLSGMIGSSRGWIEAPYVSCHATLGNLVDQAQIGSASCGKRVGRFV